MIKGVKKTWWMALISVIALSAWTISQQKDEVGSSSDAMLSVPVKNGAKTKNHPTEINRSNTGEISVKTPDSWNQALQRFGAMEAIGNPFQLENLPQPTRTTKPAASLPRVQRSAPPPASPEQTAAPLLVLPFAYLGKMEREGIVDVYLDYSGRALVAHADQILPDGWRFNGIEGGALSFTHLASNEKRMLPLRINP